ncbi:AAA family ATPase [Neotabrizicola shimadae]|uniref:AAA family ATPase n=1 Tax=Neotabrizicola shimadae TaxID=2807096 RepID=A0A8G0ZQU2_9RHOB|nr:AAA family ATPase [Neotabrizicola shimadae]QYZ68719.1 AAA family ATPase [Neotabrizicola shimadae]
MSTPANQPFSIAAEFLGPVFSLNGELTKNAQNLVFARNGTGKSFLTRAFRYLDIYGQGAPIDSAPLNLVSDESPDGKGAFSFGRGTNVMGSLNVARISDQAVAQLNNTIFHVFSEDFVQEELREQQYSLNGEIENQIAVDSANIQIKDAQDALARADSAEQSALGALNAEFNREKGAKLIDKAGVRRQLKEFASLSLDGLLGAYLEKPKEPEKTFAAILKDLDTLRSIPAEPDYPELVNPIDLADLDLTALASSLERITSPSSVSESLKRKIETHRDFYRTGVEIIDHEHLSSCPFCAQSITAPDPRTIIDAYVEYFSDEEAKHKLELRRFYGVLNGKESQLSEAKTKLIRQQALYNSLKVYLPSVKNTSLADGVDIIKRAAETISRIKSAIESKAKILGSAASLPEESLDARVGALNQVIEGNNRNVEALTRAFAKSDDERKKSQREACSVFAQEFAISNWQDIEALRKHGNNKRDKATALAALEKSSPSADARARVADTFELLLRDFFGEKYIFDKDSFVLKRGAHEMARGPHRTLSDGEKTAISFCYFVACVHRKVATNGDYHRLFLVFDDPVTSMSYDFVFCIAQALKNINISNRGEVSLNPGLVNGSSHRRPDLLVLTHSSYFFNVCATNKVVADDAAFALYSEKGVHKISRLNKYVSPFHEQLKDIYEVASGRDPDHTTANAVRSVLEAVGRFCRPDKSESLTSFVQHLASEDGITVKSILINSLCHGTYYDEKPLPDDLKQACTETLLVIEKYAAGQLEVIKGKAAKKWAT